MKISRQDRLLIAALRGSGADLPSSAGDWETVAERAWRISITPYLYGRLRDADDTVPGEIMQRLQRLTLEHSGVAVPRAFDLGRALNALRDKKVPVIVLKGAHLAEAVYGNITLRTMSDVDLMVRQTDLDRAQQTLLAAGFTPQSGRLPIDIHWGLSMAHETILNIDLDGIWERAEPVAIAGVEVLGLAPEDLLLHVGTHTSFQHLFTGVGLRSFIDIGEIIRHFGERLDWTTVSARAREWKNPGGVHLALLLARDLVGAKVPDEIIGELEPAGFDEQVVDWALEEIFREDEQSTGPQLSPYFWQLWKSGPLKEKLRNLRRLVLPPKEFIAQKYPTPLHSRRTPLYYAVRLGEHAADYLSALWKLTLRDKATLARAARSNRNIAMRGRLGGQALTVDVSHVESVNS